MLRSMTAQCKAEIMRTLRNKRFVFFSLVMPVMFYFIFTSTVGDNTKIGGTDWKAYYLMSMTVFGVVGASLNTMAIRFATERKQGWVRLIKITPLPSWAYIFSKIAAQSILNLGTIIMMFLIGALVKGVELSVMEWISCGIWIWLGVIPFLALGTLLGTLRSPEVVQVVAQIVYMGMSVLGGLWMPISTMPQLMQDIAKWLPTYRFGQGAWNIVAGLPLEWAGIGILSAYVLISVLLSSYILKRQEAV
jgi:ABC-2 type transport system permease protein